VAESIKDTWGTRINAPRLLLSMLFIVQKSEDDAVKLLATRDLGKYLQETANKPNSIILFKLSLATLNRHFSLLSGSAWCRLDRVIRRLFGILQNASVPTFTLMPLIMLFGNRDMINPRLFNKNNSVTLSPIAQNLTIDIRIPKIKTIEMFYAHTDHKAI
jgi:hypothetical protein